MSIVTTLALMATALKAAVGREQQAHMKVRASLWPELDGSALELAEAKARIAELEGDVHRANVQYRRDQELIEIWRVRALFAEGAAQPPQGFGQQPPRVAMQQAALQMQAQGQLNALYNNGLAQQNAHQAQLAQYHNHALGAQSLIDTELWCNCVPSRSQVWAAHRTG